jgi:alpha-glucosidase (family GH31 glycosyl hydrolase)
MAFPFLNEPAASCPANAASVIAGDNYRFTVLTGRLVRIEWDKEGRFEERPTRVVTNRDFPPPSFIVTEDSEKLEIRTDYFELHYRKGAFTPYSLSIDILGAYSNHDNTWRFGNIPETLKGTKETLDRANGAVELDEGLCSKRGYAILDDSASPLIQEDGWIKPRGRGVTDIYYFGYGHDYRSCIADFYRLTGAPPLLPRFSLGNWWSRYHAYTQDEYKDLMTRFLDRDLPFTVSVIDMDWHITKIDERYGRGWTGYTWNRELFPDPVEFLSWLHEHGFKATLNLHPADGVKAYEKPYREMAKSLGIDTEKENPVPFDISDRNFMAAYFKYLHHPLEEEGVDFWWLDWQSGGLSFAEGFDPLWMLNHYHSLDSGRKGKRPLIFSRYSGPGSHRYPVGFSGDTYITWESLRFQPYFTATASNIGYTFWSHDIGGHMGGVKDPELMVRWLQFGVFSPINRLHSSSSPFTSKEPWNYGQAAEKAMGIFLRLRHSLIPYLYTMSRRCTVERKPLIEPMYYSHPEHNEAYTHGSQYWLGSEMLVIPVTEKTSAMTSKAPVEAWLPPGKWLDFFSGIVYRGGKIIKLWRGLDEAPVFIKEGGVVPLAVLKPNSNSTENPKELELVVFPAASGCFTLYEDEGEGNGWKTGRFAETAITWKTGEKGGRLSVEPRGDLSALPEKRAYRLVFKGVNRDAERACRFASGGTDEVIYGKYREDTRSLEVGLPEMACGKSFTLDCPAFKDADAFSDLEKRFFAALHEMSVSFDQKDALYRLVKESAAKGFDGDEGKYNLTSLISSLHAMIEDKELLSVLTEIICA